MVLVEAEMSTKNRLFSILYCCVCFEISASFFRFTVYLKMHILSKIFEMYKPKINDSSCLLFIFSAPQPSYPPQTRLTRPIQQQIVGSATTTPISRNPPQKMTNLEEKLSPQLFLAMTVNPGARPVEVRNLIGNFCRFICHQKMN